MERFLRKYWGLAVLAFLVIAWTSAQLGPGVLALLSVAVLFWAGFQAPAWCGAANRDGTWCRKNSRGLFRGCYLREHKWQKFQRIWYSRRWADLTQGLWATPGAKLATVSGVASIVSLLAIPVTLI